MAREADASSHVSSDSDQVSLFIWVRKPRGDGTSEEVDVMDGDDSAASINSDEELVKGGRVEASRREIEEKHLWVSGAAHSDCAGADDGLTFSEKLHEDCLFGEDGDPEGDHVESCAEEAARDPYGF